MSGFDPRVVANKIIEIAHRERFPVYNVSVQKLLYFAHASHLVSERKPLVRGAFEAWEFGPVCRPIYDALKEFGRKPIDRKIFRIDPLSAEVVELEKLDDPVAKFHVESIMRSLGRTHPNQLISLSHVPGGAWSVVWNKGRTGVTIGNRIDDTLTRETFGRYKIALADPASHEEPLDEAAPFAGN